MLEEKVEAYLVKRVKDEGGVAEKFVSPSRRAVPDRICSYPDEHVFYAECKATGKKATPEQERDHERRRALGFRVYVVDSYDAVDRMLHHEAAIRRSRSLV